MGLDVSHDAWSGPYSAFNRLRSIICEAAGGSFPPHDKHAAANFEIEHGEPLQPGMFVVGNAFAGDEWTGLSEFLAHSDCDGCIEPDIAVEIANDLERLIPRIEVVASLLRWSNPRMPDHVEQTRRFIAGCRLAHSRNERMRFA